MTAEAKPSAALTAIVTWFGCGLSPKAPGTVGTLGAIPFAVVMAWLAGPLWAPWVLAAASLIVFIIGSVAAGRYVRLTNIQDPGLIVIDEVVGLWLTMTVAPLSPLGYIAGFALFRLFDITKPWPVGLADRKVGGGFGVMLDDVLAASWAGMILFLLRVYIPLPW